VGKSSGLKNQRGNNMGKNYWEEVAKIFGLELGQKVDVLNENGNRFFNSPYAFRKQGFFNSAQNNSFDTFVGIMSGIYTIKKIPWKPKDGDWFYHIQPNGKIWNSRFYKTGTLDRLLYKSGNCFKTKEEAKQNATRIVEMLKSDELFK